MSYNGWSNYETWRIHLDHIAGFDFDEITNKYELKAIVDDAVFNHTVHQECYAADYATAFIAEVDFEEIARTINEDIEKQ